MTKITCISDLHGFFPVLPGGDLLIIAGDLTARDKDEDHSCFLKWLFSQKYDKVVVVAGNHDNNIKEDILEKSINVDYLKDSGIEYRGLKVWGSPWSCRFYGMNPRCMAYTKKTDEELSKKWGLIPDDTDILITHSPPYGILDKCSNADRVGSISLWRRIEKIKPSLILCGHIHESYGILEERNTLFINASHVNERYEPVNEPITIDFSLTRCSD